MDRYVVPKSALRIAKPLGLIKKMGLRTLVILIVFPSLIYSQKGENCGSLHSNSFELAKTIEQNPESNCFDSLVEAYFKQLDQELTTGKAPEWHCGANCKTIMLNSHGQFLFDGDLVNLNYIHQAALKFLKDSNPDTDIKSVKEVTIANKPLKYSVRHFRVVVKHNSKSELQTLVTTLRQSIDEYKEFLLKNSEFKPPVSSKIIDDLFKRRILLIDYAMIPRPTVPETIITITTH